MKLNRSVLLAFALLFVMILSLSLVSADDLSDSIVSDSDLSCDDIICEEPIDDEFSDIVEDKEIVVDGNADLNDDSFISDSSLNDANKVVELKSKQKSSNVLKDGEAQEYLDIIIKNPSFNWNGGSYDGWEVKANSPQNIANKFALNHDSYDGDGHAFILFSGYLNQNIDFTVVKSINFYLKPTSAAVYVNIGEIYSKMYTFEGEDRNKWNLITIDTSDIKGYEILSLAVATTDNAYFDNFFVTCDGTNKANFTSDIVSTSANGYTIQFNDESVGLISSWLWDFGDGTTSTERNPTHTYSSGIYNASLTVYGPNTNHTYAPVSYGPMNQRTGIFYNTIQDAINGAQANDTIIIRPFLNLDYYKENLVVNKSVNLVFENCTLVNNNTGALFSLSKKVNLTVDGAYLKDIKSTIIADKSSKIRFINSTFDAINLTFQVNLDLIDSIITNASNIELLNRLFLFNNCCFDAENTTARTKTQVKVTNGNFTLMNSKFTDDFVLTVLKSNLSFSNSTLDKTQFSVSQNSCIELINSIFRNSAIINVADSVIHVNNSNFNHSRYILNNCNFTMGDIEIYDNYFVFDISNSSGLIENLNFKKKNDLNKGFSFKNSNVNIKNNDFTDCDVTINQIGGELNITNNIFTDNEIGIKIESGFANIHYNSIFANSKFGIVYGENTINGINNWFGRNDPSFISSDDLPSSYYDIVCLGSSAINSCDPWLVLNLTTGADLMAIKTNYTFFVDLTHNSNGDYTVDDTNLDSIIATAIPDLVLNFKSDYGNCSICNIVNGKGSFDYYSGDKNATIITFSLFDGNYVLPILIDSTVPQITYITPACVFNDTLLLEIVCDSSDAIIYYTLDGSNPYNSGTRLTYTAPFTIDKSVTLHIVATDEAGNYPRDNLYGSKDISVTYLKSSDLVDDADAIWSEYQGNRNNTGASDYAGPLTNLTKWTNWNIISSTSTVVDKDGLIYIVAEDGYLYCLNSEGKIVWAYGTRSKIISSPAIGPNGHIYFANWENSTLYELDNNGYLKWKYELGDYSLGSSIKFGPDGTLYAISGNDSFTRLFAFKDQKLKWTCDLGPISGSTPAIAYDGTVYLVLRDNTVALINWDGSIRGYLNNSGIIGKQATVAIGPDGFIYILKTGSFYRSENGQSIFNNDSLSLFYINGTKGLDVYEYKNGYQWVYGSPVFYNGIVYLAGIDKLYAFNSENYVDVSNYVGSTGKKTLELLWMSDIAVSGLSASSPIVSSDGIIYIGSNNTIYAFDPDGSLIWSYELTGQYGNPMILSSPTLTDDGTLIVPTTQGIWAFNDLSADFTFEYANGTERGIKFTPLVALGENTYYWRFGDYRYSSLESPVHEYFKAGNYTVYLTVNHSGVLLGCNKTIEVTTHDITPPTDVVATINGKIAVDATYRGSQNVTMTSSDNWGEYTIYYTVDGSNPTNSSTRREYYGPVEIETDTILQFSAVDPAGNWANVGKLNLTISDAIIVNETLVEKIQRMLDEAEPNSKIIINYDTISGANFTINKPLNIISTNNTLLVGNGVNPVFAITQNASGTKINGFRLENIEHALFVNGTKNVNILNTLASSSLGVGFNIVNSNNTVIKDSISNDSYYGIIVNRSRGTVLNRVNVTDSYSNGIHIKESQGTIINNSVFEGNGKSNEGRANNILLDDSTKTDIKDTYIAYGFFGIHFENTNRDVQIINNTIFNTRGDGILFEGAVNNVNVSLNTIDGSFNGLNFNGYYVKVAVTNNVVWHMDDHGGAPGRFDYNPPLWADTYGQYENCVQISAGSRNFGNGVYMENNVFIKQSHRSWESRHTSDTTSPSGVYSTVTDWERSQLQDSCAGHDYNLWDGSGSLYNSGGAVGYSEGRVNLVVDRIGDSTFRARLQNMRTGEFISNLDPFTITFTAGRYVQDVNFTNDSAIAVFNTAATLTSVEAKISMHIKKSISWDTPITEGYNSSSKDEDPGRVEGDAYDNRKPTVAPMYETDDERRARLGPDAEGSGSGNGNGNGHGTGLGNGTGSGMGEGQNSGEGNGRANIKAGDESMPGSSTDVSTVFSQSQSAGGDASTTTNPNAGGSGSDSKNAYELDEHSDPLTKSIELDNPMKIALIILLSIFLAIGYNIARENEWMK